MRPALAHRDDIQPRANPQHPGFMSFTEEGADAPNFSPE
jgi:hypothetical protein